MYRLLVALLLVIGFVPGVARAVDILNVRACYGPFGASRLVPKCLPGDFLFMTYDIDNLMKDKNGKVRFDTLLQLVDPSQKDKDNNEKVIFEKRTPNEVVPLLGGARMPGDLHVVMSPKQAPGKYAVLLKVEDKVAEKAIRFRYDFEVVAPTFGFIDVKAPAFGLPGFHYVTSFGLVNLGMNAKSEHSADLTIKILDDKGTAVSSTKMMFPRDTPDGVDLKQANFIPLSYPVYLNRPGLFTVEIVATDNISKKTEKLSLPLNVLDANKLIGK